MLEVCLLGTGGTMPMPDRALTALMVRHGGHNLLIDCGEGTQVQIRKMKWSIKAIDHILFTHVHGDHIIGLPGLLLSMGKDGRTEPLHLYGPKGLSRVVAGLKTTAPELPFDLQVAELDAPEHHFACGDLRVHAFEADHSTACYGYSLYADRARKFDPEKAAALGIPKILWSILQKGESANGFTADMVLGEERQGLKVAYVTDTRPTARIQRSVENADLLVCEGMYGDDSKLDMAVKKQHMLFSEAAQLAANAHVHALWLTHYSPSLEDPQAFLPSAQAIFPETKAPADLETLLLTWKS